MKIGIIGAGSIGMLMAAYLSRTNIVTLYTRTREQATDINKYGLCVFIQDKQKFVNIEAVPVTEWGAEEDLTIVAVKQYQLAPILVRLMEYEDNQMSVLFLQNGMGHLKDLAKLKVNHIYIGSVEHGAYKENSFTVRHNGVGMVNIAAYRGVLTQIFSIKTSARSDFPVAFHSDYYEMLLNKLIINAVINPLTAILQVQNGLLLKNENYLMAARQLFLEINNVLHLEKPEDDWQRIMAVCRKTADNRSSMLRDIEAGNNTEVDAILGFLIEEAEKTQIHATLISSYYYLIKGKENNPIQSRDEMVWH